MAWFKKGEEGEPQMTTASIPARTEPREHRAEPRPEPRVEPRTPSSSAASSPPTSPPPRAEAKGLEPRPVEVRAPEMCAPEPPRRASVLGPTLRFRGELSAQEDLVVQGSVEGSITHTQSLTIGTEGSMSGDIRARVIVIDGKVDGDLYATESVNIRATAKVKGNVFAPRVAIQDGAFFQGQVDMQPTGAAVQEHSARLKQAAVTTPALEGAAVDQVLSGTGG